MFALLTLAERMVCVVVRTLCTSVQSANADDLCYVLHLASEVLLIGSDLLLSLLG
jgi:hypothetical protein